MKASEKIAHGIAMPWKSLLATGFAIIFLMGSCDLSNEGITPGLSDEDKADAELVQMDEMEGVYFEDSDDLAGEVLELQSSPSGKIAAGRFSCATITRTGDENGGTVTVDFGAGCPDDRGRTRRGKIVVQYSGRVRQLASSWRTTFVDYFVNDIQLEGTRVVTISKVDGNTTTYEVDVEDGSAKFPDGGIARRRLHRKREAHRNGNNILERLIIYGTEEGNHRNGRGFFIDILEPLEYSNECAAEGVVIPVKGKKLIKHGQREITIDYGDGRCDNVVIITNKNGRSWEYRVTP